MASLVLNVLVVLGTAALGFRLYSSGLSHRYRGFFFYLIFATLQAVASLPLDLNGDLYLKFYVLTEPVSWIFCVWVVLELYALVLKDYQGIYTVLRRALKVAVAMALLGSVIIVMIRIPFHGHLQVSRVLPYIYPTERAIYFSLVIFLLTIVCFLLQYPVILRRNIILHTVVYTFYFLSNTVLYLVLGAFGLDAVKGVGYALQAAALAALITWLTMLNPAGEERQTRLRPAWMPGQEAELIAQLNSLNQALLSTRRK